MATPTPTPTPSARLVRAAAAERAELARYRDRLLAARDRLRAELDDVEASLRELDERNALLDRLAGPVAERPVATPVAGPAGAVPPPGPALRRRAGGGPRAPGDRPP